MAPQQRLRHKHVVVRHAAARIAYASAANIKVSVVSKTRRARQQAHGALSILRAANILAAIDQRYLAHDKRQ